jgi:hypothetical protein
MELVSLKYTVYFIFSLMSFIVQKLHIYKPVKIHYGNNNTSHTYLHVHFDLYLLSLAFLKQ